MRNGATAEAGTGSAVRHADNPNAPKLRFPEFAGEWEEKPLGDVSTFSKGKGISKADISPSGATPCIRYGELYTHYGTRIDDVLSATNVPVANLKLSHGGEVIVPASGEDAKDIATAAVVLQPGVALGGDLNIIRSACDGFFLASYIAGKKRLALAAMAQGNSVVHLYPAQLGSLALSLPTLPEQQKISAFLGAVDAKLAALAARQAALGRFKAGLMQKLFSQQLRFTRDDGGAFPDWQEKRLGEVADIYQPQTISQTDLVADGYTVYGANGIIGKYTNFNHELEQVTVTCRGNTCGTVGFTEPFSWITGNAMVINLDKSPYSSKMFIYFLLTNTDFSYLITGSGQPQITGVIKKHKFLLPHPDEQAKIADALSVMDAKIQAVADQIAGLERFKKGLLQQMFV